MKDVNISENIIYIGADDKDIDLFESQYIVPNGISYNSYLIKDTKIAIMDTIDNRKTDEWLNNLESALCGSEPDYLIISHLEPDHAYNIKTLTEKYPNIKLVGNDKTFAFLPQFFDIPDLEERKIVVKENDSLCLGNHTLRFIMAPMVHWPEVMVEYEETEKILFSADGFGKFGALDTDEDWDCEARRYYFNIVGKYGMQVQMLLKKVLNLDIKMICPLHGPILKNNLEHYIEKYNIWSSYEPENKGVFIACSSIHGNTLDASKQLKGILEELGETKVVLSDLSREDMAECIEDAFRYDRIILASSSYNFGLFTPMEQFLLHLKERNYQNRTIGIIENGTWAPTAGKCMKDILSEMKNITLIEPMVTIKSTLNTESKAELEKLAKNIVNAK
ncbi:MAG: FprA family A-type flavoprotein [Clostridia bacterium]|nr:FprA family A-type flavoprotein [Clostridia bacterium]